MKKFLAIALALVLVLSLSVTAFAADEDEYTYVAAGDTVTITKNLTVEGYVGEKNEATVYPVHSVTFTEPEGSVADGGTLATEAPDLEVAAVAYEEGDETVTINVTVPDFPDIGIYTYTFSEVDPEIAGVTVYTSTMKVVFTVINNPDYDPEDEDSAPRLIVAGVHCEASENDEKTDEFDNLYESGALEVSKALVGNMVDKAKEFSIKVTFESDLEVAGTIVYDGGSITPDDWSNGSASVTISLVGGASVEFDNIPDGVTYTVVELDGDDELDDEDVSEDGYTVTYDANVTGDIAAETLVSTTVTNTKETTPDTGISLDSLPYILIVAVVLTAAVVMVVNKRRSEV